MIKLQKFTQYHYGQASCWSWGIPLNHKYRLEGMCVQSWVDHQFSCCWLQQEISTSCSETWPHKALLSWVDPRIAPATPWEKPIKDPHETKWPPNAKGIIRANKHHLGKEEWKGRSYNDKNLNLELMGTFIKKIYYTLKLKSKQTVETGGGKETMSWQYLLFFLLPRRMM